MAEHLVCLVVVGHKCKELLVLGISTGVGYLTNWHLHDHLRRSACNRSEFKSAQSYGVVFLCLGVGIRFRDDETVGGNSDDDIRLVMCLHVVDRGDGFGHNLRASGTRRGHRAEVLTKMKS